MLQDNIAKPKSKCQQPNYLFMDPQVKPFTNEYKKRESPERLSLCDVLQGCFVVKS